MNEVTACTPVGTRQQILHLHANSKSILFHHFLDMVRPTDRKKISIEKIVCYNHRSQEQEAGNTTGSYTGKSVRR